MIRFANIFRSRSAVWAGAALLCTASVEVVAQDARRGAGLYMQLPNDVPSCVSCHGPEPQGNRNSLLKAARNPPALIKALSTVGVMSYLRASLHDGDVQDLAAFLGSVIEASSVQSALNVWPLTADFGQLRIGAAAGPQRVLLHNRSDANVRVTTLQVHGAGYALTHDCPGLLAPGAVCQASVVMMAATEGRFSGALEVTSPEVSSPLVVALASKVRSESGGELQWLPDLQTVDFSGSAPGKVVQRRVALVNAGMAPVTLGAAPQVFGSTTLTGSNLTPWMISGCASGTVLAPSAQCDIDIRHAATTPASSHAVLQVRSDGMNPASLRLVALGASASSRIQEAAPTTSTSVESIGGGAIGRDAIHLIWGLGAILAIVALWRDRL